MQHPPMDPLKAQLLDAALPNVPFDGWSQETFDAAVADTGTDPQVARALCPRGPVDLAIAYHKRGDAEMVAALRSADLAEMRFRDKVAFAIRVRLDATPDKEVVRRGTALFALPHLAPDGAKLIWDTADAIWEALGDPSDDINWYTKRATLAGVIGSTVLFWLGDRSEGHIATDAFIDRRIGNVMQIESLKATVRNNPLLSRLAGPLTWAASQVKAPSRIPRVDLPGQWTDPR